MSKTDFSAFESGENNGKKIKNSSIQPWSYTVTRAKHEEIYHWYKKKKTRINAEGKPILQIYGGGTGKFYVYIVPPKIKTKFDDENKNTCTAWVEKKTGIYHVDFSWTPVKIERIGVEYRDKRARMTPSEVINIMAILDRCNAAKSYENFKELSKIGRKIKLKYLQFVVADGESKIKINKHEEAHGKDFQKVYNDIIVPMLKIIVNSRRTPVTATADSPAAAKRACIKKLEKLINWKQTIEKFRNKCIEVNAIRDSKEKLQKKKKYWAPELQSEFGKDYIYVYPGW